MKQVDDENLQKICGTDAAMYLIYLKYCSYFFGSIAILNVIFIGIFLTGEPLAEDDFRQHKDTMFAMQALTILNISGSNWKVLFCFLNSMITIPALMLNLIMSYSNKFSENDEAEINYNINS